MVAAKRGQHADAERLCEEAAAVHEQAGDRWQLSLTLTMTAHVAFDRGDDARALGPLLQALRLARDSASGERMSHAVELAAHVLHHRGRAREAATLLGAIEANLRLPREAERMRSLPWRPYGMSGTAFEALASALVSAGCDEHRVAGRSLSLERATDLALRVVDEELAASLAAEVRERGGAAGSADTAPTRAVTEARRGRLASG